MSFTYENQGTNTFLVYTLAENEVIDSMSLGMLTNNKIEGLAGASFMQIDTDKFIKYNVSAKISVSQFFTGTVNKARLLGVFSGIVNAMLVAEDYMIDVGAILLDKDYIFADVSTFDTVMICLPIVGRHQSNQEVGAFFKNILFSTQFDQTENCDYVARLINYLNSNPIFSLADFKKILDEIREPGRTQMAQQSGPSQSVTPQMSPSQPVIQEAFVQQPSVQQPEATQNVQPVIPQPQVVNSSNNTNAQPTIQKPQMAVPQPAAPAGKNMAPPPMMIPGKAAAQAEPTAPQSDENSMSLFYLLQHYNKENAATYKAQKADKKTKADANPAKKDKSAKKEKAAKKGNMEAPAFAIPGGPTPPPMQMQKKAQNVPPAQNPQMNVPSVPQNAVHEVSQQQSQTVSQPQQAQPQQVQPQLSQPQIHPQMQVQPQTQQAYSTPSGFTGQTMNFGETTVLNAPKYGETTVLSDFNMNNAPSCPYLIRKKTGERVNIDKPVFRIGKEKSYVDYFIGDNSAISRSHANIVTKNGDYYIVDTNSTNHTYINNALLQSNVEVKLEEGISIKLANEEFEFKLH